MSTTFREVGPGGAPENTSNAGQRMWTGYRYAVHFTDRFVFGSDKLENTYGGFTSNYFFENKGGLRGLSGAFFI